MDSIAVSNAPIFFAVKPKYPTRKAVDTVLIPEKYFGYIVECDTLQKAVALLDTSYIAIFQNNKFYPVKLENLKEQFLLAFGGCTPTVPEDPNFCIIHFDYFIYEPVLDLTLDSWTIVQEDVSVFDHVISGKIYYLKDPSIIGVTGGESGYYLRLHVDLDDAADLFKPQFSYTNIKLYAIGGTYNEITAVDGDENILYMGPTITEANKKKFGIKFHIAAQVEGETVEEDVNCVYNPRIIYSPCAPYIKKNPVDGQVLDGTAIASHVYFGDTFYATNTRVKVVGSMPVNPIVYAEVNAGEVFEIPMGYHSPGGKVKGLGGQIDYPDADIVYF